MLVSSERNLSDMNDASRNGQPVIGKANETVKVEQDRHVSILDIAKELNIRSSKSSTPFQQNWLQKKGGPIYDKSGLYHVFDGTAMERWTMSCCRVASD